MAEDYDSYVRRVIRQSGATERTGVRVTVDPARASHVRDPQTGQRHDRKSPVFKKWERRLADR